MKKNQKARIKNKKLRLKKGDTVLIAVGKDKGKTGKIEKVIPASNKILVTGVNVLKKHTPPTKKNPHGGVIQINVPFSASNVMLLCPRCNKPTRVGTKMLDTGKKLRICKKCRETVEQ